jgi:hypothetical protein
MKQSLALAGVLTICCVFEAVAQPADICSVALTEQAYDVEESTIQTNLMFAARDDICEKEYDSVSQARSEARSGGFNVGHAGVSIGVSGAKQSNNGKWSIKETAFCKATASDLQTSYGSEYRNQVARIAVQAWLECVKSSNQNLLYLEYAISPDGQLFTGRLRTTASTGPLQRTITGISVVGDAADTVVCNIAGKNYKPDDVGEKPVEITTTGTSVACSKSGSEGASIALQTSQSALPFVHLPSEREVKVSEFDELAKMIEDIRIVDLASATQRIEALEDVANQQTERSKALVSRLDDMGQLAGELGTQLQALSDKSLRSGVYEVKDADMRTCAYNLNDRKCFLKAANYCREEGFDAGFIFGISTVKESYGAFCVAKE